MHPRHASQELSPTNDHEPELLASFLHSLRDLDAAQSPPKSKALATPNRDLRLDMNFWTDSERLFEIMEPEKQSEFDALSSISESSGRSDCEFSPGAVLTPPASNSATPIECDENKEANSFISVSTTFYPGANIDPLPTDLIILSSDSVFFYVHSQRLMSASENGFNQLLPAALKKSGPSDADCILNLPETSTVLNVVLHAVYGLSCAHYSPSLGDLSAALATLKVYGLPTRKYLASSTPLSTTLLSHAPTAPLDVYAIAASHNLHELAVSTSPHLLSFSLPSLSDDQASKIGSVYLKRLFFLHLGRMDALKRLLLPPPHPHATTNECDFTEQKKLTRAWALASAYLTWDARPDMSASSIEAALLPLCDNLACELCKTALRERIRDLIIQWSQVKTTI